MAKTKDLPYTSGACSCETPRPAGRRITGSISWNPCAGCGKAIARDETKTTRKEAR